MKLMSGATVATAFAVLTSVMPASAQTVESFYKGKTIKLVVGSGAGGGNDVFARIFAKYLPKHLPGSPMVIVQNVPAAGGVVATAQMANTQPRDGTVIAAVNRTIPMMPLLVDKDLNFDSRKLGWLGSLNKETNVIIVWHTSPVNTIADVQKRETIVGTTGGSSDSNVYALLLNQTLDTKFKIVGGYPGGPDIDLAMERGEVEGRVSITWTSLKGSRSAWLKEKKVKILAQMALQRSPELPDVPNVLEMVKDPKDRQVYEFLFSRQEAGRPFVAPPELPADRLAALRKALEDVATDKHFIADVEHGGGTVELLTGEELQKLVNKFYATPPEILKAARAALEPN
jgi:tripartite-type tricarboxylate transporter receptor subunit TctC